MHKLLIAFIVATTLVSCSQQKFAFRKKISVSQEEQQAMLLKSKNKPKASDQNIITESQAKAEETETILADASAPSVSSITKERNVVESERPDLITKSNPDQQKTLSETKASPKPEGGAGNRGGWAIAGFVLSLLGLLVAAIPFGILAIIFGAIALKSPRRRLAIAAILIGFIDIFLGIVVISRM